jgi:ribonuclease HII
MRGCAMSLFGGIDEAGRGPVIGPLVMGMVLCSEEDKKFLKDRGVTDSKLLSEKKREELAKIIKKNCLWAVIKANPLEVDKHVLSQKSSLNILEAELSAKLINILCKKICFKKVIIDLPTKNKKEYLEKIINKVNKKFSKELELSAEFKADLKYIEVGAASILAKTARDKKLKKLSKELSLDLGSGYPSDPKTKDVLEKHLEILLKKGVVRESWKTISALKTKREQKRLDNF